MSRKKCAVVLVLLSSLATCLFAQGLITTASKDDWEEINFEFNYAVLTDGFPSLLRLAELLQQNPGYKVHVEGHTDSVGSAAYNEKLALARANTVRDFLVKYGANPSQITVSGRGKTDPKVDNRTPPGRFMNRRAVLTVTDAQGRTISAGGVGDAIKALSEIAKKQEDCCNEILKKLDKLDEILAMLRDLKKENEALKKDVADLKQAQTGLKKEVQEAAAAPKAPEREIIREVVKTEAARAVEAGKSRRFSLLGLNAGPDMTGNLTFTGKGRFFAPFNESHALQAEGEYMRYFDRQEGQFDIGLVNRFKNVQLGLFSSIRHANVREFQQGGTLGQGALTFDYLFRRGRVGFFGTKAFRDDVVINRRVLSRNIFEETYMKAVDQIGGSTQIGLHGNAYVEGNLGALFRRGGDNRPGGTVRFVQPINENWAFTVEAGLNETLIGRNDSGRVAVGIQLGNWVRPKEFAELTHPVPVDVPRLRYELLKRRVRTGNDAPVADAGPDQIGVRAGTITLDGSGSFDPDGDPITYAWTQISGPSVSISGANTVRATFTAAEGQRYTFRLTVRDDHGGQGVDRVAVSAVEATPPKINRFTATPNRIHAGELVTLAWDISNADEAEITGLGRVDPRSGTSSVAPTETTVYQLKARNRFGEITETLTVNVERLQPLILRFEASPMTITAGGVSTLAWETENADSVTLTEIGPVRPSGTTTVSPRTTTDYRLTARNRFGEVNRTVTVQVVAAPLPRIISFVARPYEIQPGEQATLMWEVENATEITIDLLGKVQATGTSAVSPTETTTYTLTASNQRGQVQATAVVTILPPVKILDFVAEPPVFQKPGDPVTLRWTTVNATEVVITGVGSVPVNGSVTVRPTVATSYSLIAYGKRSQATAIVVVKPAPNRPPVAIPGPDRDVQAEDPVLDGSRSYDPDGDPITFSWRYVGTDPEVKVLNPNSAIAKAWLPGPGVYMFELTVTDDKGAFTTAPLRLRHVGR